MYFNLGYRKRDSSVGVVKADFFILRHENNSFRFVAFHADVNIIKRNYILDHLRILAAYRRVRIKKVNNRYPCRVLSFQS